LHPALAPKLLAGPARESDKQPNSRSQNLRKRHSATLELRARLHATAVPSSFAHDLAWLLLHFLRSVLSFPDCCYNCAGSCCFSVSLIFCYSVICPSSLHIPSTAKHCALSFAPAAFFVF
jgi:hypothetical protein